MTLLSAQQKHVRILIMFQFSCLSGSPLGKSSLWNSWSSCSVCFVPAISHWSNICSISIVHHKLTGNNCAFTALYGSWFSEVLNTVHGNCFIFNSGWNDTSTLMSHRTGRRFGTSPINQSINQSTLSTSHSRCMYQCDMSRANHRWIGRVLTCHFNFSSCVLSRSADFQTHMHESAHFQSVMGASALREMWCTQ